MIADALHTTLATAEHIRTLGLHYILTVKGNRPLLLEQLRDDYHWQVVAHSESGLGHGRIKRRTIQVSPELDREVPWVAFPGARFEARLVREVVYKKDGKVRSTEVVYLLTSPPAELATPEHLLQWSQLYWTIENRVHYVRDTALREDACRMRKGSLPRVMAAFANLAISVLRLLDKRNLKRAMSNFKLRPNRAVAVVWLVAAGAGGPYGGTHRATAPSDEPHGGPGPRRTRARESDTPGCAGRPPKGCRNRAAALNRHFRWCRRSENPLASPAKTSDPEH